MRNLIAFLLVACCIVATPVFAKGGHGHGGNHGHTSSTHGRFTPHFFATWRDNPNPG